MCTDLGRVKSTISPNKMKETQKKDKTSKKDRTDMWTDRYTYRETPGPRLVKSNTNLTCRQMLDEWRKKCFPLKSSTPHDSLCGRTIVKTGRHEDFLN